MNSKKKHAKTHKPHTHNKKHILSGQVCINNALCQLVFLEQNSIIISKFLNFKIQQTKNNLHFKTTKYGQTDKNKKNRNVIISNNSKQLHISKC